MGKGMFSGAVWGAVTGVAVMALLSLYAPLPGEVASNDSGADEKVEPEASGSEDEQSSLWSLDEEPEELANAPKANVTPPKEVLPDVAVPSDIAAAPEAPDAKQTQVAEPEAEAPVEPAASDVASEEDVPLPEIVTVRPAPGTVQPTVDVEPETIVVELDETAPSLQEDAPAGVPAPEAGPVEVEAPVQLAKAPDVQPLNGARPAASETDEEIVAEAPSRSEVTLVVPDETPVLPALDIDTPVLPVSGDSYDAPDSPSRALPKSQLDVTPAIGDEAPDAAQPENSQLALDLQSDNSRLPTIGGDAEPDTSSSSEPITLPVPENTAPVRKVVINRLPSITAPSEEAEGEADAEAVEEEVAEEQVETAPDQTPSAPENALQAFAAEIDVPADADLVGLILIDDNSSAGMPMGDMLQLAVPFSIAIDPSRADAADRAAQYRAAGIEVLAIIDDLPPESAPADVAVAMESYFAVLDESIGVLDPLDARIQGTRSLISPVLDALKANGRALVTYDRGLNPAQQLAERQGVPAATVFRILDGEAEEAPKIKRYLDRAAFNANRDGAVVVLGRNYPETVKALLEWSLAEKGAGLSVVPVSKLLLAQ